jgi:acyl carrier protein
MKEISEKIRAFVTKNFYVADAGSLRDEDSLLDKGIVDSTAVLEVISFLEGTFDITVQDDEMLPENLDSIARIAAFVTRKKAASP